jgi:hypothetical protein
MSPKSPQKIIIGFFKPYYFFVTAHAHKKKILRSERAISNSVEQRPTLVFPRQTKPCNGDSKFQFYKTACALSPKGRVAEGNDKMDSTRGNF